MKKYFMALILLLTLLIQVSTVKAQVTVNTPCKSEQETVDTLRNDIAKLQAKLSLAITTLNTCVQNSTLNPNIHEGFKPAGGN